MAFRRASTRPHDDEPDGTPGTVARRVFLVAATAFGLIGAATAIWLSRANVADGFFYGSTGMGSAVDPAGFYLSDVILFFEPEPMAHDYHPGVTTTLMGAVLARGLYAVWSPFEGTQPYVAFWVRHRVVLSGLLAGLATFMLLACCHPLFKVLRQFMDRSTAYLGCTVFLASIPTLLYASRFSPEAWMLFFSLWSIHLSLRALAQEVTVWRSATIGICTALALFSKWLALPVAVLNVYSLLRSPAGDASGVLRRLAAYAVAAGVTAAALSSKLSLAHVLAGIPLQLRASQGFAATLALGHEEPFVLHNALVFGIGTVGLAVMYRAQPHLRGPLTALVVTVALMAIMIVRRPLWHYFFGFYWLFASAGVYGLTRALASRSTGRSDLTAVAAGVIMIVACNAWAYPGVVSTYAHYRARFLQRATLAREHPAWLAAPWEYALSDYEATRDPARVVPVYGHRLTTTLKDQRLLEDGHAGPFAR